MAPSEKIRRLAVGGIESTRTLGSLEEIERWILSWGEHVTVLETGGDDPANPGVGRDSRAAIRMIKW